MRRSFAIAAFLIVFGSVCGMFNTLGIYNVHLPESEYSSFSNEETISKLTNGTTSVSSAYSDWSTIFTLAASVFKGIIEGLLLAPLMISLGIPVGIAVALSTPIWFIYGIDLLHWWGNRND